jgi:CO dehydrogenase maturation factor
MIKTTPAGCGSRLLRLDGPNPVFEYFVRRVNGVDLMVTGSFQQEDLGVGCYHSKTGAVELLLNHLVDREDEYVIVDMTAGADAFASGLFTKFDVTYVVCEPTRKSLGVYAQYVGYAEGYDVNIKAIANKTESPEEVAYIKNEVGDAFVAAVPFSRALRASERGEVLPVDAYEPAFFDALRAIQRDVDGTSQDWELRQRHAIEFHRKNAESWANAQAGQDLCSQIDPEFRFPSPVR